MLKKKQVIQHEDFMEALRNVKQLVPRDQFENLLDDTVAEVRRVARGKRVAYAWSGGKDSQALRLVCERAGVTDCVFVMCNLEYPAFLSWVTDNMPPGLHVINTGQDMTWLAEHQDWIFPRPKDQSKWFGPVQWRGQEKFFKERELDLLVMGRRHKDGNFCGTNGVYSKGAVTRYSPIRHWSHEDIFAAVVYYNLPLPPIYDWPRGFRCGTSPWPGRMWTASVEAGWDEIWQIDPSLVRLSVQHGITSAQVFMNKRRLV